MFFFFICLTRSGTIGCMGLLKKLANKRFKRTIKVVFFDGEEPGILNPLCSGSLYFSKSDEMNSSKDKAEEEEKKEDEDHWQCTVCTFFNVGLTAQECSCCGEERKNPALNVKLVFIIDMIGAAPTEGLFYISTSNDELVDQWAEKLNDFLDTKKEQTRAVLLGVGESENCIAYSDSRYFSNEHYPTMLLCNCSIKSLPTFYHNTGDDISIISWGNFMHAIDISEFMVSTQAQQIP